MLNGESEAMSAIYKILESFPQEAQIRMLKYLAAQSLGWSGCRLEQTLMHFTEVPTKGYA